MYEDKNKRIAKELMKMLIDRNIYFSRLQKEILKELIRLTSDE